MCFLVFFRFLGLVCDCLLFNYFQASGSLRYEVLGVLRAPYFGVVRLSC